MLDSPSRPRVLAAMPLLLVDLLLVPACGQPATGEPTPIDYYNGKASAALGSVTNQATCSTCHSNDGSPRSGNTFKDIAYHTSFKGGDAGTLLAASNACVTGWMGGVALKEGDVAWERLRAYLQSISDPVKTAPNTIAPEVLQDQAAYEAAYAGGDGQAGAAKYARACGVCHDAALRVNDAPALAKTSLKGFSVGRIAQKARTAGPPPSGTKDAGDNTPGPMPFFEPTELPAGDLKDIIAYLRQ